MKDFQDTIFIWTQTYGKIFKSASVYFYYFNAGLVISETKYEPNAKTSDQSLKSTFRSQ